MSKYVNDVRSLSANAAYQGVEFGGVDTIDEAIEQARQQPDHGLAEQFVPKGVSRNRAALLQHLNLLLDYKVAQEDDALVERVISQHSLEYALQRGWVKSPTDYLVSGHMAPDLDAMNFDPSN